LVERYGNQCGGDLEACGMVLSFVGIAEFIVRNRGVATAVSNEGGSEYQRFCPFGSNRITASWKQEVGGSVQWNDAKTKIIIGF
jgi:hypothetical protein